jgi:hypothetical protein
MICKLYLPYIFALPFHICLHFRCGKFPAHFLPLMCLTYLVRLNLFDLITRQEVMNSYFLLLTAVVADKRHQN